jgi:hypothetical protein
MPLSLPITSRSCVNEQSYWGLSYKKGWINIQPDLQLSQSPARQTEPGVADLHRVLADVTMRDGDRQRIGGVSLRVRRQF